MKIFNKLTRQSESIIVETEQNTVVYTKNGAKEKNVARCKRDEKYYDFIWEEGE